MARETVLRSDYFQEDTLAGDPVAEPETDRLIGRKIGTIRIHKLLGEGGMGAVYAGFDERLRREVAQVLGVLGILQNGLSPGEKSTAATGPPGRGAPPGPWGRAA